MKILQLNITPTMLHRAQVRAAEMGVLKNSILAGQGSIAGFLGEDLFAAAFPASIARQSFDYDLIFDGHRVEVKSVQTEVVPMRHFQAHVAAYNTRQDADIYVFARICLSMARGWLMGWIWKKDWLKKARFAAAGDTDGTWVYPCDCFNLRYDELTEFTKNFESGEVITID
jgi:hypothetical protein